MFVGVAQMRVLSSKTTVAMLLGLITPFLIIAGFGGFNHLTVQLPVIKSIFSTFSSQEIVPFAVASSCAFFFGIILLMLNFLKLVGYNARIRSAYGLMTVTLLATLAFAVIDYNYLPVYMPLMIWGIAFQASHLIMSKNGQRTYIAVFSIILYCLYMFIWNIIV